MARCLPGFFIIFAVTAPATPLYNAHPGGSFYLVKVCFFKIICIFAPAMPDIVKLTTGQTADRKHRKGLCVAHGCKNNHGKGRWLCDSCTKRKWRNEHPIEYAYETLKSNAKRRGKECTITLEYFRGFCDGSDYIEKKGIYKDCLTIDRKRADLGYVPGNLQVLTNSYNVRKKYVDKKWEGKESDRFKDVWLDEPEEQAPPLSPDVDDLPF